MSPVPSLSPSAESASTTSTSTKSRRSSCDTPDQPLASSCFSTNTTTTTTSGGEVDDDFDSPSTIKYKLIAGGGFNFPRTPTGTTCGNIVNSGAASLTSGGGNPAKSQVNIITNPLVRQYPFETNYKTKKMYANETIVTHQPGGNLKTISYGNATSTAGAIVATTSAAGVDLKRSPLVNRRRSSSVTLPQPPMMMTAADRYRENSNTTSGIFDGGIAVGTDCRNSR